MESNLSLMVSFVARKLGKKDHCIRGSKSSRSTLLKYNREAA